MGVLKKYAPYNASAAIRLDPLGTMPSGRISYSAAAYNDGNSWGRAVPKFYDLNGNEWTRLFYTGYNDYNDIYRNTSEFFEMTGVGTDDILEDFDIYDHSIMNIATSNSSNYMNRSAGSAERVYTIRITNNNTDDRYIQNTDLVWRSYRHYYTRSGSDPDYIYTPVTEEPLDFAEHYSDYWVLVSGGPLTIKCIKFRKGFIQVNKNWSSGYNTSNMTTYQVLYCAYFLDPSEWITIPVGESRVVVVDFAVVNK